MKLVHAVQALSIAGALLSVPFTVIPTAAVAVTDAPERLRAEAPRSVVARHSGKCLDVHSASTADGANVIQWTCTSQPNQQWRLVQKGNNYFSLVARHSGKCLDVYGASMADGANVIQWTCSSQYNQQWRFA